MSSQYFEEKPNIPIDKKRFKVMSKASYDDNKLLEVISDLDSNKLFACAAQLAIVGFAKNQYGTVMFDEEELDVKSYLESQDILCDIKSGEIIPEDKLTAKRLIRVFRYQIQEYLEEEQIETFLYKKYCNSSSNPSYVFPMAEYLIDDVILANELVETYRNLDDRKGSNFVDRVISVFQARDIDIDIDE